MQRSLYAAALMFVLCAATSGRAQPPATPPGDLKMPAPGTRGDADNIPYLGRSDPSGNPVRLARATGHVSNYNEEKIPPYTLPDPLVLSSGERVNNAEQWF